MKRRRRNGFGIDLRPSGSYRIRVTVDGRRICASAATFEEAVALRARLRADRAAGSVGANETLQEYLAQWLTTVESTRAPATLASYTNAVKHHIAPQLGSITLRELAPSHVLEWLSSLRTTAGSRSAQNAFKVLSRALNEAATLQRIEQNPLRHITAPRHERNPIDPFTQAEAAAIMRHFQKHYPNESCAITLAFGTGLRVGELLALRWSDLNFEEAIATIERQLTETGGQLEFRPPKSRAGIRRVILTDETLAALHRHRAAALVAGRATKNELVFQSRKGGALRRSNLRSRRWLPTLAALGIERRPFHQIRHTFATHAINCAGVSLVTVSRLLGHSKPSVTLDIYAHVLSSDFAAARDRLNNATRSA